MTRDHLAIEKVGNFQFNFEENFASKNNIHFLIMSQVQTSTIYVADLPASKDPSGQPVSDIEEDFLRELFQEFNVVKSPEAVTIKTKLGRNGNPYSYAFIKFESREDALKAIADMNYTKLNNIPIRLMTADKETKMIVRNNQGNLFIKNLDPEIEVSQLHDAFSNFGEIISCKIPSDIKNVPREDNPSVLEKRTVSRGYGYVQFRNQEDAKQAMADLKDASINGHSIEIQPFCRRQHQNPATTFTNIYIKNFPETFTDDDIKQLFEGYGTPLSYKVVTDENGTSKQFGFCCMKDHEEALKAVEELNGKEIDNLVIQCCRAMSKAERLKELQTQSEKWRKANFEKYKGRNLYVRNLDENTTEDDLMNIFSDYGHIESARIMRDENGNSRKFGFICFSTQEEANKCLKESTLALINDKQAYVAMAMSKDQRMKENLMKIQQRKMENNSKVNNAQSEMAIYQGIQQQIPFQQPSFPYNQMLQPQNALNNIQPQAANFLFSPENIAFNPFYQNQIGRYTQDAKTMLRSEIIEKYPNNTILLQKLRDMSDEQANELATNQELFIKWMELQ